MADKRQIDGEKVADNKSKGCPAGGVFFELRFSTTQVFAGAIPIFALRCEPRMVAVLVNHLTAIVLRKREGLSRRGREVGGLSRKSNRSGQGCLIAELDWSRFVGREAEQAARIGG